MDQPRALGLIRVSTGGQVDGLGLDDQIQIITAHCEREGYDLQRIFADEGVPGDSEHFGKRNGLAEALETLRPGTILVTPRMDRLARDLLLQETILGMIIQRGARLESAAPGEASLINGDNLDPTRTMVRQIFGVIAQYERSMITMRLAGSRRLKGLRGGHPGGVVPFEQMIVGEGKDSRRVPDPSKTPIMKLIERSYDDGMSQPAIAALLTAKGIESPKGGPWKISTVRRAIYRINEARGIIVKTPNSHHPVSR